MFFVICFFVIGWARTFTFMAEARNQVGYKNGCPGLTGALGSIGQLRGDLQVEDRKFVSCNRCDTSVTPGNGNNVKPSLN